MLRFSPFEKENGLFGYTAADEADGTQADCLCALEGMYVTIRSLSYPPGREDLAEGLLRSVCSYGANRNAFVVRAKQTLPCASFLQGLGFSGQKDLLQTEIPELLMGDCQKIKKSGALQS